VTIASGRERGTEAGDESLGMLGDVGPGREHKPEAVAGGDAPLVLVPLVVGGVVVPPLPVGLENHALAEEGEVVSEGLTALDQWMLADEAGQALHREQSSREDLELRS